MFPLLPKSAITDALGKVGGNVHHALDALLKINQRLDKRQSLHPPHPFIRKLQVRRTDCCIIERRKCRTR
jgi:hypothetical protein